MAEPLHVPFLGVPLHEETANTLEHADRPLHPPPASVVEETQFACDHVTTHICAMRSSSQQPEGFLCLLIPLILASIPLASHPEPHWTVKNMIN